MVNNLQEVSGLIPGSGRSLGGGTGNPLQCSCLENPVDRGAWGATVHEVAESDITEWLSTYYCKLRHGFGRRLRWLSLNPRGIRVDFWGLL